MVAAVCSFDSVQEAVDTVTQVMQCGVPMARIGKHYPKFVSFFVIHPLHNTKNYTDARVFMHTFFTLKEQLHLSSNHLPESFDPSDDAFLACDIMQGGL